MAISDCLVKLWKNHETTVKIARLMPAIFYHTQFARRKVVILLQNKFSCRIWRVVIIFMISLTSCWFGENDYSVGFDLKTRFTGRNIMVIRWKILRIRSFCLKIFWYFFFWELRSCTWAKIYCSAFGFCFVVSVSFSGSFPFVPPSAK